MSPGVISAIFVLAVVATALLIDVIGTRLFRGRAVPVPDGFIAEDVAQLRTNELLVAFDGTPATGKRDNRS